MAFAVRQHRRNRPLDRVTILERDTSQVTRFHLRQADIDKRCLMLVGDLRHHLGLAHTGSPPQHHWGVVTTLGTDIFFFYDG